MIDDLRRAMAMQLLAETGVKVKHRHDDKDYPNRFGYVDAPPLGWVALPRPRCEEYKLSSFPPYVYCPSAGPVRYTTQEVLALYEAEVEELRGYT